LLLITNTSHHPQNHTDLQDSKSKHQPLNPVNIKKFIPFLPFLFHCWTQVSQEGWELVLTMKDEGVCHRD